MVFLRKLHPLAGFAAICLITLFLLASLVAEIGGNGDTILHVKRAILWALPLLIALLAASGASGVRLAHPPIDRRIARKMKRMRLVAVNGIGVLVPSALFLAWRASHGLFDTGFYVVQGVELAAGTLNLALLLANARDGFALHRKAT